MPSVPGDLRYPSWLAGTWRVTTTATGFSMPLGPRFVDPFLLRIATEEVRNKKQLQYVYRFVDDAPPPEGQPTLTVRQDRRYNAIEEEKAFIAARGATIERGMFVCNAAHPHGRVLLDVRDDNTRGLVSRELLGDDVERKEATWVAKAVIRTQLSLDIAWAAWEERSSSGEGGGEGGGGRGGEGGGRGDEGGTFVTSELAVQRALLPSRVIDESLIEILTSFERPSEGVPGSQQKTMKARYRVAQYLSLPGVNSSAALSSEATRKLAKQADGRAVSVLDYDLLLEQI